MSGSLGGAARRVALFVDGDNLPPSLAAPILDAAGRLGQVDLRRVYAAEGGFRAWEGALGFRPIRVGGAKNGTDLLLCIDAVELACKGGFDAFALASNDRDFSHLAHWLRERGAHVMGLGTSMSPPGWRASCSAFEILAGPTADQPGPTPKPTSAGSTDLSEIDAKVRALIHAEGENGSMAIGSLGVRMGSVHKVTLTQLGTSGWRAYLEGRPKLYELDPRGAAARTRWIGP